MPDAFPAWFTPKTDLPGGEPIGLLPAIVFVTVVRDPPSPLLKAIAIGIFPVKPPGTLKQLTLGPGNVLLNAQQIAANSPVNSITGFQIKSGTLTFPANITVVSGVIHIGAAETIEFDALLDPPAPPAPVTGPGSDATAAVVTLPASVTIVFAPVGGQITKLSAFSATVYGMSVSFAHTASAPHFDSVLRQILAPASVTPATFVIAADQSTLLTLSGSATITGGAWSLPVMTGAPPPSTILGAGDVAILLGSGLQAQWTGLPQALTAQSVSILAAPGQVGVMLTIATQRFSDTFQLWQEQSGGRNSTIEFDYPVQFTVPYESQPGHEKLQIASGSAVLHLDRPLRADGTRFALPSPSALLTLLLNTSGPQITLAGSLQPPPNNPPLPMALENALLQVQSPQTFSVTGALSAASISAGTLNLNFQVLAIIATLPDPYAASIPASVLAQRGGTQGPLSAAITWATAASAQLAFTYQQTTGTAFSGLPALLDVSSNADQWGVRSTSDAISPLTISQLTLQASGAVLGIFTVPEISWEPMTADASSPPPAGSLAPPDDGGPSTLSVKTVQLVPVAPASLAPIFVQSAAAGALTTVGLTLPFGIRANISDLKGATIALNQPEFPGSLTGGIQIKLLPASPDKFTATFDGNAFVTAPYGTNVLDAAGDPSVSNFFNSAFGASVPVRRYDLSGYGASVFSDWRNLGPITAGVTKVQFEVFVGRTAYDVVQIRSLIYPWAVRVVRTITIERANLGGVTRHDSGWQAISNGDFQFSDPGDFVLNLGAVAQLVNARNIQANGAIFPPSGTPQWLPVTFDADVQLNPAITIDSGASGTNTVASRGITGYLLETVTSPPFIPPPASVVALLSTNLAAGPVSCTVTIASSGAQLRGAGVDVTAFMANANQAVIACALRGSPVLPPDGAWSVGKRSTLHTTPPLPLDPNFPVPLVQNATQPNLWYYADPTDVLNLPGGTPGSEYGLLQSTGTQKLFFAQPKITQGISNIHPQVPPHLADVGALLNAVGIFPDLKAALQMATGFPPLDTSNPNGLKFHFEFDTVDASKNPLPSEALIDFGSALQLKLAYSDGAQPTPKAGHAVVDIQPGSWTIHLQNISFPIITPFGNETDPLLRIVGDAQASSSSAPTLSNLTVVYGGALGEVETVFSQIEHLASFLPGAPFANLDVHFSNGQLTIRDTFALPELPLGIGFIEDVSLDLGMTLQLSPQSLEFTVGLGSEQKPFHWLVSPLSGTGAVVVGMKNGLPAFLVQAGIGAGLSIDIGIAKGAASIVLQVQIATDGTLIHLKALLTGSASVDVLDGLASASLTMTAGLGITPRPLPLPPDFNAPTSVDFVASVAVGIHITICWVAHVDFDGYWQYSQTIDLPDIGSVIPT
jgi:hypothetical protein